MLNLSVIMPTRNADEHLLARALNAVDSVNAQACVFYDEDEHPKIIPFGHPFDYGRVGKIAAMNRALALAVQDYVFYCGDDDYIGAGVVALVDYLERNPSVSFAYGDQQYMGDRTDLVRNRQYHGDDLYQSNLPLNAIVYRRNAVLSLGGYRDILGDPMRGDQPEDYDLLLRAVEAGHRGVYVPTDEPVHYYTLSSSRMWALMQQNADEVYRAFKAHHPKYIGGRL